MVNVGNTNRYFRHHPPNLWRLKLRARVVDSHHLGNAILIDGWLILTNPLELSVHLKYINGLSYLLRLLFVQPLRRPLQFNDGNPRVKAV